MSTGSEKSQDTYLKEILDSARQARSYVRGQTFEKFWDDQKTRDAVAMRLHVIGEAASKVTASTAAKLPRVPFGEIRGMRNRIAHDYGRVNFRVVWKTVQEDLSPLISELAKYLERTEESQRADRGIGLTQYPDINPSHGPRMGM